MRLGTLGFIQGAQLRIDREKAQAEFEKAQREKHEYDQNQAAIAAGQRLLAGMGGVGAPVQGPPNPAAPQPTNGPQLPDPMQGPPSSAMNGNGTVAPPTTGASFPAPQQGPPFTGIPGGMQGPLIPPGGMQGPPSPQGDSKATQRQQEWHALLQHHSDVENEAQRIALGMKDPQTFLNGIHLAMAHDAHNLQAIHTADDIHDGVLAGAFDPVDPVTGKRVPSPEVRQFFSDLSDKVKSGQMDPLEAEHQATTAALKLNTEAGEIGHRIRLADAAEAQLGQMPSSTALQHQYIDALRTGTISGETWQKEYAGPVMAGLVPNPRGTGWVTESTAALEQDKMRAEAQALYAKPYIEQAKEAGRNQRNQLRIDSQAEGRKAMADQKEKDRQLRADMQAKLIKSQEARSATQAGFSPEKAKHQALVDTVAVDRVRQFENKAEFDAFQKGLEDAYMPKGKAEANPDEVKLIGEMKAQGKTDAEIKAEILKRRGGK